MIRILIDSSSDYTLEDAKAKNMDYVSIGITLNEQNYQDGIDITKDTFYELLTSGTDFPKTSQPSPQSFVDVFEDAKEKGDELICILLSSGLSGTCQSAHLAKNMVEYDNIHIVDSLTATVMIKILADHACALRDQGASAAEITDALEALKGKVKVVAAVDTMEFLYRGGRVSKAAAAIGELAKIKPVISVTEDGKVTVIGKCLGKNKAIRFFGDYFTEHNVNPDFPVISVYTLGTENAEKMEEKAKGFGFDITGRHQIGATIGAHLGPGVFGMAYVEA